MIHSLKVNVKDTLIVATIPDAMYSSDVCGIDQGESGRDVYKAIWMGTQTLGAQNPEVTYASIVISLSGNHQIRFESCWTKKIPLY